MSKTTDRIAHFQSLHDFKIAISDGAVVTDSAGNLVVPVLPLVVYAWYETVAPSGFTPPSICVEVSDGNDSTQLTCESGKTAMTNFAACKVELASGNRAIQDPTTGGYMHGYGCGCTLNVNLRSVHYNTSGEAVITAKGGIGEKESGEYSPVRVVLDVLWNGRRTEDHFYTCGVCGDLQKWFEIKIRKTDWSAYAEYEIETVPASGICGSNEDTVDVIAPYRWCSKYANVFTETYPVSVGSFIWDKKALSIEFDPEKETEEEAKEKAAIGKVASVENREYIIGGTAGTRYWRDETKDEYFVESMRVSMLRDSDMNPIYITYGISDSNRPAVVEYFKETGKNNPSDGEPIYISGGTTAVSYEIVYAEQCMNRLPEWGVGFRSGHTITTQSITVYTDQGYEELDDYGNLTMQPIDKLFEYYESQAADICDGIDTHVYGGYSPEWEYGYLVTTDAGIIELALSPVVRVNGRIYADVEFYGYLQSPNIYVASGTIKAWSTVPCGNVVTVYSREDTKKYYSSVDDATEDVNGTEMPEIKNDVYSMVSVAGNTYYFDQYLNETDKLVE